MPTAHSFGFFLEMAHSWLQIKRFFLVLITVYAKPVVLNLWPAGQTQPMISCYMAHGSPHRSVNLALGEQWQSDCMALHVRLCHGAAGSGTYSQSGIPDCTQLHPQINCCTDLMLDQGHGPTTHVGFGLWISPHHSAWGQKAEHHCTKPLEKIQLHQNNTSNCLDGTSI